MSDVTVSRNDSRRRHNSSGSVGTSRRVLPENKENHRSRMGRKLLSPVETEKYQQLLTEYVEQEKVEAARTHSPVDMCKIVNYLHDRDELSPELIALILSSVTDWNVQYIDLVAASVDLPMSTFHGMSPFQFVIRTQVVDVRKFFYDFGPYKKKEGSNTPKKKLYKHTFLFVVWIGRYRNIHSPLHLAARRLTDVAKDYNSHIVKTSPWDARQALDTFSFLIDVGYHIDDGDWGEQKVSTPQSILKHMPRILKQILCKFQFHSFCLAIPCVVQSHCIFWFVEATRLDLFLLREIEMFTFNQIPKYANYRQQQLLVKQKMEDQGTDQGNDNPDNDLALATNPDQNLQTTETNSN
ncbi:hypothetical protein RFI_27978 [Reticulomyxa filosa]|uniref:Uncharacterized protein n=1 Tax=Reticulomyxa filosa TaxID=46433 RepID=X6M716_RETFI|nr:hypothetical protein RFI_27978 [Reticulomyxa filosa]|eukprot:ETO09396.1 hypothetical protein RFI_27978 [Reticulomyxa filosa]